jgi:hypothetical protein
MLDMVKTSATLFFRGRLFADNTKAFRQIAIGVAVTALLMLAMAKIGAPLVIAAIVAGFLGGALQPVLFKDLKYR